MRIRSGATLTVSRWCRLLDSVGRWYRSREVKLPGEEELPTIQLDGVIPHAIHIPLEEPLRKRLFGEIEESVSDQELKERVLPVEEWI
jgi:hypothetical protein